MEMEIVTLKSDFHGVPAGTRLRVVRHTECWASGVPQIIAEREDGKDLPVCYGKAKQAPIQADLVECI
jgi:hypothetical protein